MRDEEEEGIWYLRIKIASDATIWELNTKEKKVVHNGRKFCQKSHPLFNIFLNVINFSLLHIT